MPGDPGKALDVTLATSDNAVTVRADRFRADLQRAGLAEGCYGFSVAAADLPGYRVGVNCVWADLGLALPGSPWSAPVNPGKTFTHGKVRLRVDTPLSGDRRLTGYVFDAAEPLHRVKLGAICEGALRDAVVASLYRSLDGDEAGDGFHGFNLSLPAPLRMLAAGVQLVDVRRDEVLAQLGPRSF
jgi:hypothetical protein